MTLDLGTEPAHLVLLSPCFQKWLQQVPQRHLYRLHQRCRSWSTVHPRSARPSPSGVNLVAYSRPIRKLICNSPWITCRFWTSPPSLLSTLCKSGHAPSSRFLLGPLFPSWPSLSDQEISKAFCLSSTITIRSTNLNGIICSQSTTKPATSSIVKPWQPPLVQSVTHPLNSIFRGTKISL